ncbi:phosphatidylserine decarboxylase-related protein [Aspergillus steynii IBT 23096]|uniref:Phosphatidylserine decarboxylase-related protein n=1 Tax=Aspergillus steynii IBT 23096 TaxID=1392250 RepID=A0A2I2GF39_9EURO|nr:phosphatidylserine decarboxylase-related protein [Aspergillus steynii IBT 23096]PLB51486.1 phosphatidylserine decarboxylase-related protein [Aspergillus steynii IBT 23096]
MHDKPVSIVAILSAAIAQDKYWENAFKKAVANAQIEAPIATKRHGITSLNGFYTFLSNLLTWVPVENSTSGEVLERLMLIHFIFNQKPIYKLQSPIHPSTARAPLSWLSQWMIVYAKCLGLFLDTPDSLTEQSLQTFRGSPHYRLEDYIEPEGGWKSFNEFFARQIKPDRRPIAEKETPPTIVSPVDCGFAGSWPVDDTGRVTFKGIPWEMTELLQDSQYADEFKGGTFMHFFLTTTNYHRQHAPVSGQVLEAKTIQGQVFLEVTPAEGSLESRRKSKPTGSSLIAVDGEGFQWCQTRGLVVLDTPVGLVAVLPVGMSQVSSVRFTVREGDELRKGDEMSFFQFGGSDVVLVFQQSSHVETFVDPDQPLKMGERIGRSMAY